MKNFLFKKINNFVKNGNNSFFKKIKNGRNNKVYCFFYKKKKYILKIYNKRNKNLLLRESKFLSKLKKYNINNVPKIIYKNNNLNYAIFNFIEGSNIKTIKKDEILQVVNFIKCIKKISIKNTIAAKDKCSSLKDHIDLIYNRLNISDYYIHRKLKKDFTNYFNIIKFQELPKATNMIFNNLNKKTIVKKLSLNELILSPSDFGFHNVLKKDNKLFFIDFEYAGNDDIKKLICDFLCQPDFKMSTELKDLFLRKINFNKNKKLKITNMLISLHKIKWCLILLNPFKKTMKKLTLSHYRKTLKKSQMYFNNSI